MSTFMSQFFIAKNTAEAIPITPIVTATFADWLKKQSVARKNWITASRFTAKHSEYCLLPGNDGAIAEVLLGIKDHNDFWACGHLPAKLKNGVFYLNIDASVGAAISNKIKNSVENSCKNNTDQSITTTDWTKEIIQRYALAWGLGSYKYTRYKKDENNTNNADAEKNIRKKGTKNTVAENAQLVLPSCCNYVEIENTLDAVFLVRDLINHPAEDLCPKDLAKVAIDIAKQHRAKITQIKGEKLLRQNYPLIHAVGRSSDREPYFVEFEWGKAHHPRLALIGKGICFDSGGLNLKPSAHIEGMHRDMAGAAHALALAQMIMRAKLPIHLHVALPMAENLISGNSIKPGDVITSRHGKTVEINDTDAEGRLLLADALTRVAEKKPQLIIDFASLTGAAIVALGAEITAMFTEDENVATAISNATAEEKEYVWRLPLHQHYREMLDSVVADIKNCSTTRQAGAITAALFLREFVPDNIPWIHFDLSGENTKTKPGRPEGGEAVVLKGLFTYIKKNFAQEKINKKNNKFGKTQGKQKNTER